MTRVLLNTAAIEQYGHDASVKELLDQLGAAIAQDAADAAPEDTGAGARSITHELGEDTEGLYVRVSWDKAHFYMVFSELGTSHQPATPFLRPAALKRRSL